MIEQAVVVQKQTSLRMFWAPVKNYSTALQDRWHNFQEHLSALDAKVCRKAPYTRTAGLQGPD